MKQFAFRVPEDLLDDVETYADENDVTPSEAGRRLLAAALENERQPPFDERLTAETERIRTEYEDRVDSLETEVERLHRERRQLLEQREENQELMAYVGDEKRYRHAGVFQRFRWWFRGMD